MLQWLVPLLCYLYALEYKRNCSRMFQGCCPLNGSLFDRIKVGVGFIVRYLWLIGAARLNL